jgi:hypothetical protein
VLSSLPSPFPASLASLPLPSISNVLLEGAVQVGAKMSGDGSASGESRQLQNTCYLTTTSSVAGRPPPPLYSVISRLLDLYHECMNSSGRARVLYREK